MFRYKVLIDENFHYMDKDHRYEHGTFDTAEQAIKACHTIVDSALQDIYAPGMSAAVLFTRYTLFGEDPFIVPLDRTAPSADFSAWDYAKAQSEIICALRQTI
jgi:hypothetical protein